MTDAEIMEVAQKDLIVIQDVLAGKRPPEHLRDATHLIKAYHEYLSKIRKLGMIRPWETSSLSQVRCYSTSSVRYAMCGNDAQTYQYLF